MVPTVVKSPGLRASDLVPNPHSNMMPSKFTQMGVGNIASQFLTSSGGMIRKIDDRVSGSN